MAVFVTLAIISMTFEIVVMGVQDELDFVADDG
jgi:hypothetical protein